MFEAEEEPEPTDLMQAVQVNFEASSGGHGALAGFAFMVFVLLLHALHGGRGRRAAGVWGQMDVVQHCRPIGDRLAGGLPGLPGRSAAGAGINTDV